MLWFNFILGLNFIFFCFKLIIIHYHTQKQKKIKFKPRIKLNHNTYNLLLWRSIVTCNRCDIVSSHKCLPYTNQTFFTMSFNRKLIKFFWGGYLETERPCLL